MSDAGPIDDRGDQVTRRDGQTLGMSPSRSSIDDAKSLYFSFEFWSPYGNNFLLGVRNVPSFGLGAYFVSAGVGRFSTGTW